MLKKYIQTFRKYKNLIFYLAKNKISLKYRKSYLGILWSMLNPLLTMIVLTLVFSKMFHSSIANFPIYVMCGRLIFEFNGENTRSALGSIVSNASLIKKIYVPKYVFPLSDSIASLMNMLFSFIALILVMLVTKTPLRATMLLVWIPIVYVFMFSTGLGLILASVNVFFRDIKYLYNVLITLWMYLSAIFYPVDALSETMQQFIRFNPLYHYIKILRGLVLDGTLPSLRQNLLCIGVGVFMMLTGFLVMKKTQDKFIIHI